MIWCMYMLWNNKVSITSNIVFCFVVRMLSIKSLSIILVYSPLLWTVVSGCISRTYASGKTKTQNSLINSPTAHSLLMTSALLPASVSLSIVYWTGKPCSSLLPCFLVQSSLGLADANVRIAFFLNPGGRAGEIAALAKHYPACLRTCVPPPEPHKNVRIVT